jgi:hypothetical protein
MSRCAAADDGAIFEHVVVTGEREGACGPKRHHLALLSPALSKRRHCAFAYRLVAVSRRAGSLTNFDEGERLELVRSSLS